MNTDRTTAIGGAVLPSREKFDTAIDGKQNSLYFLSNKNNFRAAVTNYGARMVGFLVPDKNGKLTDIDTALLILH